MPKVLLSVPHIRQRKEADCLAACAAMGLAYVGVKTDYERLLKLLKVTPYGTAGQNLTYLASNQIQVSYREGNMDELKILLQPDCPCITLVRTSDLPYWSYATDHAVVVVGYDEGSIYVNDPAFEAHPQAVPLQKFELAWLVFDYRFGVLSTNPMKR
ncbi:MAG: cysteine peptidase family C39 domain-containing protein [Caldilineaceae bacterium]